MLPQLQDALNTWETNITLVKVTQSIDPTTGEVIETQQTISFIGVIQQSAFVDKGRRYQQVTYQTGYEGQRDWSWFEVHTREYLELVLQDRVIYNGQYYRVMSKKDYSSEGFYAYEMELDYQS